ncbi:protein FAM98A-like [Lytechinus variegatus]|uniref:protein FAM98A-like n=1 Tax=Lytechinus variegatus TaxID=7654 RepID=UPI001BB21AC8|nr:protein FAM98A-like [Lytechinus variegatus]
MSRTPNYHMNPYSGGTPSRNSGFSPYQDQNRGSMGPPGGHRHGYFTPQQGEAPMIGGGIIPGQRYPSHNNSPFSTPSFQQSPYQPNAGSSPHESPNRGGGRGGYQRRDSRGWGRGRGGGGGRGGGVQFTPSGHQQFHNRKRFSGGSPYQRGQHGGNSSVIERYFKQSMLEDPWKNLVAKKASVSSS